MIPVLVVRILFWNCTTVSFSNIFPPSCVFPFLSLTCPFPASLHLHLIPSLVCVYKVPVFHSCLRLIVPWSPVMPPCVSRLNVSLWCFCFFVACVFIHLYFDFACTLFKPSCCYFFFFLGSMFFVYQVFCLHFIPQSCLLCVVCIYTLILLAIIVTERTDQNGPSRQLRDVRGGDAKGRIHFWHESALQSASWSTSRSVSPLASWPTSTVHWAPGLPQRVCLSPCHRHIFISIPLFAHLSSLSDDSL